MRLLATLLIGSKSLQGKRVTLHSVNNLHPHLHKHCCCIFCMLFTPGGGFLVCCATYNEEISEVFLPYTRC